MNKCDCQNYCGDDDRVAKGEVLPCQKFQMHDAMMSAAGARQLTEPPKNPCPCCGSMQIELCSDSNNPMKDLYRCRECKTQARRVVWEAPRALPQTATLHVKNHNIDLPLELVNGKYIIASKG